MLVMTIKLKKNIKNLMLENFSEKVWEEDLNVCLKGACFAPKFLEV